MVIAPKEGHQVHGLLWKITRACETSLDFYEGYPRLYEKEPVTVRDKEGRQLTVMAYVMTDNDQWRLPAICMTNTLAGGIPLAPMPPTGGKRR